MIFQVTAMHLQSALLVWRLILDPLYGGLAMAWNEWREKKTKLHYQYFLALNADITYICASLANIKIQQFHNRIQISNY